MVHKRFRDSKGARERQKQEKRKRKASIMAMRSRYRQLRWNDFKAKVKLFFGILPPTPEEAENKKYRSLYRQAKRKERMQKLQNLLGNPYKTLFTPSERRVEIRLARQAQKKIRRIEFLESLLRTRIAFRELTTAGEVSRKYRQLVLLSTAWYLLAFLSVYLLYQLITIIVASSFNVPVIWSYDRLIWPLSNWSPLWTRRALVFIFGIGPFISLTFAFFFLGMFLFRIKKTTRFHIFFLWCFILGLNMFFGSYIVGVITRTEFIYTSEWIFLSNVFDKEEIIFSFLSLAIMFLTGRLVAPLMLITSPSLQLLQPRYRFFYFFGTMIVPWLCGIFLFFIFTLPEHYLPFVLKTITPGFILVPVLLSYKSLANESIEDVGLVRRYSFRWSILIIVVALLFFFRIIMNFGWKIG